ncbi:MAG TPA: hypothetical protein VGM52_12125 [Herbaspirillum sp.]
MRGQLQSIACTTFILGVASTAVQGYAAEPGIAAAPSDGLCSASLTIDKEKLAAYVLKRYPVSTAYLSFGAHPAPLQSNRALLHWLLAKRAAEAGQSQTPASACNGGDACNMDRIATAMQNMLDGKDHQLTPSAKIDPEHFFATDDAVYPVRCAVADAAPDLSVPTAPVLATAIPAAPNAAPAPAQPSWIDRIRVRGNPDQLAIDKSDTSGYASVQKAQVDFSNDSVAGSRTNDVQAYAGYSWLQSSFGGSGSTYEAVPYVGFKQNRVIVNAAGATTVTTTRTSDIGLLSSFHFAHLGTADAEDFNARPDYLMDSENGTRLLSANFTYTVIRKGWLNDLIPLSKNVSVKPIFIAESRNGTYIDRGDATVAATHQDFLRLGAQAGFALISKDPRIPVDFTATYTGLAALVGSQGIHYVKADLTYNFNQDLGLVLDYSNGLLPDTGDREKKWGLGVASKF